MPVYSYSRLSTFETCPLQYKCIYIDKLAKKETIEQFLGQRFHEVMERLYKDLPVKTDSLEECLAYYEAQWDKEFHGDIAIVRKDWTAEGYRKLGRKFIADYYKRYHPFSQSRALGLERQISIDLDGSGKYRLTGYIDRLAQAEDGAYEIHDYKTSSSLPEQKKIDEDRQLALYQIGLEKAWNDVRKVRLVWHYVAFDKEVTSERTRDDLERLKTHLIGLIDEIERTPKDRFEPRENTLCDWCGYWEHCPLKKHLTKVEELPSNEFLNEDGVKLVNVYAELDAKKKELKEHVEEIEAEIDKVKEAIVAYSKREGASVLRGSGHLLKVSEKLQTSSPAKGSKERAELEKILREAGRWDEVAALDSFAVARAFHEKKWDASLLERVKAYLTLEQKYSLTLSQIKEED
jgi:putative RecB family exonuclease